MKTGELVLSCPNNKRSASEADEEKPKRRAKKAPTEEPATTVKCDYSRPIPEPQAVA